jgi:hypothetical protein
LPFFRCRRRAGVAPLVKLRRRLTCAFAARRGARLGRIRSYERTRRRRLSVVSHDWGARATYTLATLVPERLSTVTALSLAYSQLGRVSVPSSARAAITKISRLGGTPMSVKQTRNQACYDSEHERKRPPYRMGKEARRSARKIDGNSLRDAGEHWVTDPASSTRSTPPA